uniref:Uncharacterized protein n=1 Tax=Aegilops tauschii subsp. strangulata TaxID=200361 RepID=A0A453M543_AEGTS
MLSSARRCAPLSVSIRASLWYCSPNSSHSPRSSLEAEEPARALSVGDELVGETMPLRHGRRVYRLAGLRPPAWYEVKISYPASIPSSFSIRLVSDPDAVEDQGSKNRRLLNTEKIIFKAESTKPVYVLVMVEPEGVVAKPNVKERELALFNIGMLARIAVSLHFNFLD